MSQYVTPRLTASRNMRRFRSKLPPSPRMGTWVPEFPNGLLETIDGASFDTEGFPAWAIERSGVRRPPVLTAPIACKNSLLDCMVFDKISSLSAFHCASFRLFLHQVVLFRRGLSPRHLGMFFYLKEQRFARPGRPLCLSDGFRRPGTGPFHWAILVSAIAADQKYYFNAAQEDQNPIRDKYRLASPNPELREPKKRDQG